MAQPPTISSARKVHVNDLKDVNSQAKRLKGFAKGPGQKLHKPPLITCMFSCLQHWQSSKGFRGAPLRRECWKCKRSKFALKGQQASNQNACLRLPAQVDGCCKVAPLVALLAGQPSLLPSVDLAIRVVQNTDKAAAFACGFARVLEKLVLGTPTIKEAISAAQADLSNPDRAFRTTLDDEVAISLGRVIGEFADQPQAEVGMKLKPESHPFPFIGLS